MTSKGKNKNKKITLHRADSDDSYESDESAVPRPSRPARDPRVGNISVVEHEARRQREDQEYREGGRQRAVDGVLSAAPMAEDSEDEEAEHSALDPSLNALTSNRNPIAATASSVFYQGAPPTPTPSTVYPSPRSSSYTASTDQHPLQTPQAGPFAIEQALAPLSPGTLAPMLPSTSRPSLPPLPAQDPVASISAMTMSPVAGRVMNGWTPGGTGSGNGRPLGTEGDQANTSLAVATTGTHFSLQQPMHNGTIDPAFLSAAGGSGSPDVRLLLASSSTAQPLGPAPLPDFNQHHGQHSATNLSAPPTETSIASPARNNPAAAMFALCVRQHKSEGKSTEAAVTLAAEDLNLDPTQCGKFWRKIEAVFMFVDASIGAGKAETEAVRDAAQTVELDKALCLELYDLMKHRPAQPKPAAPSSASSKEAFTLEEDDLLRRLANEPKYRTAGGSIRWKAMADEINKDRALHRTALELQKRRRQLKDVKRTLVTPGGKEDVEGAGFHEDQEEDEHVGPVAKKTKTSATAKSKSSAKGKGKKRDGKGKETPDLSSNLPSNTTYDATGSSPAFAFGNDPNLNPALVAPSTSSFSSTSQHGLGLPGPYDVPLNFCPSHPPPLSPNTIPATRLIEGFAVWGQKYLTSAVDDGALEVDGIVRLFHQESEHAEAELVVDDLTPFREAILAVVPTAKFSLNPSQGLLVVGVDVKDDEEGGEDGGKKND